MNSTTTTTTTTTTSDSFAHILRLTVFYCPLHPSSDTILPRLLPPPPLPPHAPHQHGICICIIASPLPLRLSPSHPIPDDFPVAAAGAASPRHQHHHHHDPSSTAVLLLQGKPRREQPNCDRNIASHTSLPLSSPSRGPRKYLLAHKLLPRPHAMSAQPTPAGPPKPSIHPSIHRLQNSVQSVLSESHDPQWCPVHFTHLSTRVAQQSMALLVGK